MVFARRLDDSVFIFGLCAKILIKTDMAVIPTFFIAFFLSAAAELAISLLQIFLRPEIQKESDLRSESH
jgi:hypothetical protein